MTSISTDFQFSGVTLLIKAKKLNTVHYWALVSVELMVLGLNQSLWIQILIPVHQTVPVLLIMIMITTINRLTKWNGIQRLNRLFGGSKLSHNFFPCHPLTLTQVLLLPAIWSNLKGFSLTSHIHSTCFSGPHLLQEAFLGALGP